MFYIILLALLVDYSYQLCQKCEVCSRTPLNDSSLCKCDADCGIFGDCCGSLSPPDSCPPPSLNPLLPGVVLECQSIYLNVSILGSSENKGFLMVSSCPTCSEKVQEASGLVHSCTSKDILPPVTDLKTGIVYRNEYCAYFNGVEELVTWQIDLVCSHNVHMAILQSNLSALVDNDPMIFQRECQEWSFRRPSLPSGIKPPRSCLPTINFCLSKPKLENMIGNISFVEYTKMKNKCSCGVLDPVEGINGLRYKNPGCAKCNAVEVKQCCTVNKRDTYISHNNHTNNLENGTSPSAAESFISVTTINSSKVSVSAGLHDILLNTSCLKGNYSVAFHCHDMPCISVDSHGMKYCPDFTEVLIKCYFDLINCSTMMYTLDTTQKFNLHTSLDFVLVCAPGTACSHGYEFLNLSEYVNFSNVSILYEGEHIDRWYINEQLQVFICKDSGYDVIGLICHYIAHSFSVVGAFLIILTYSIFKELRTLPATVIINFTIPIFMNSFLHLFTGKVSYLDANVRVALAIAFHYLQLTQLMWMSIFSCEVLRKFYLGCHIRLDSKKSQRNHLIAYLCAGWCPALIIVLISVIVNFTSNGLVQYGLNDRGMYMLHFKSYIVAVATPGMACVVFSIVSFFIVTFLICKQARAKIQIKQNGMWRLFRLWFAALSVSGLTYLPYLIHNPLRLVYVVDYYHESQGFFIFLAFFLSKKVFNLYFQCIPCKDEICNISKSVSNQLSKLLKH